MTLTVATANCHELDNNEAREVGIKCTNKTALVASRFSNFVKKTRLCSNNYHHHHHNHHHHHSTSSQCKALKQFLFVSSTSLHSHTPLSNSSYNRGLSNNNCCCLVVNDKIDKIKLKWVEGEISECNQQQGEQLKNSYHYHNHYQRNHRLEAELILRSKYYLCNTNNKLIVIEKRDLESKLVEFGKKLLVKLAKKLKNSHLVESKISNDILKLNRRSLSNITNVVEYNTSEIVKNSINNMPQKVPMYNKREGCSAGNNERHKIRSQQVERFSEQRISSLASSTGGHSHTIDAATNTANTATVTLRPRPISTFKIDSSAKVPKRNSKFWFLSILPTILLIIISFCMKDFSLCLQTQEGSTTYSRQHHDFARELADLMTLTPPFAPTRRPSPSPSPSPQPSAMSNVGRQHFLNIVGSTAASQHKQSFDRGGTLQAAPSGSSSRQQQQQQQVQVPTSNNNGRFVRTNELDAFLDDMNNNELRTVASGYPIRDLFHEKPMPPKVSGGNSYYHNMSAQANALTHASGNNHERRSLPNKDINNNDKSTSGLMGSHSEQQIYSECALILQRTYVKNIDHPKHQLVPFGKTEQACISYKHIDKAIEQAKHKLKFREFAKMRKKPVATAPGKPPLAPLDVIHKTLEPPEDLIAAIGEINMATTQIIADQFDLSNDELLNGLPLIDMSKTKFWKICPLLVKQDLKCELSRFRTFTGHCNNLKHPTWGAAMTPFARYLPPVHPDGIWIPRKSIVSEITFELGEGHREMHSSIAPSMPLPVFDGSSSDHHHHHHAHGAIPPPLPPPPPPPVPVPMPHMVHHSHHQLHHGPAAPMSAAAAAPHRMGLLGEDAPPPPPPPQPSYQPFDHDHHRNHEQPFVAPAADNSNYENDNSHPSLDGLDQAGSVQFVRHTHPSLMDTTSGGGGGGGGGHSIDESNNEELIQNSNHLALHHHHNKQQQQPTHYHRSHSPMVPFEASAHKLESMFSNSHLAVANHHQQQQLAASAPPAHLIPSHKPSASRSIAQELPSARLVTSIVHRDMDLPTHDLSILFMSWGQLLDHDMTRAAQPPSSIKCCPQADGTPPSKHKLCLPIQVPANDPFYSKFNVRCLEFRRTLAGVRPNCVLGPRVHQNAITSPIDANFVYGSSQAMADGLRLFRGGRLRDRDWFRAEGLKPLLPAQEIEPDLECIARPKDLFCFLAGDVRANEQTHLTVLHTLYMREHNRLADKLAELNPHWDDERIYQETRHIIAATVQHVMINEYIPLLIGRKMTELYNLTAQPAEHDQRAYWHGYDPTVTTSVANSFAAAAFRQGHTFVQGSIERYNKFHEFVAAEKLRFLFKQPFLLYQPGVLDELTGGLINQASQQYDPFISEDISGHLFQPPELQFGHDLAAINLQRGREQGLPGYNLFREWCGLPRAETFEQLEPYLTNRTAYHYSRLYKHVDDIDLWSGGVSERKLPGAAIGPTFACIIARQFSNTRRGDRFWYENPGLPSSFTPDQLAELRKITLAKILCSNSDDLPTIQRWAFRLAHPVLNPRIECTQLPEMDLQYWQEE